MKNLLETLQSVGCSAVRSGVVLLSVVALAMLLQPGLSAAEGAIGQGSDLAAAEDGRLFPLGVYWPWEENRTGANAKTAGLDRWTYTDKLMGVLRKLNLNMVWVIHMPPTDLPRFCELADKHGLKVAASSDLKEALPDYSPQTIDRVVGEIVDRWRNCRSLVGYVGFDEPKGRELQLTNMIQAAFRRHDPSRSFVVVVRPHEMEMAMYHLTANAVAVDPYEFFHPGGPWRKDASPEASQSSFVSRTGTCSRLSLQAGKDWWSMPQAFSEAGGYLDEQRNKLAVRPGSYLSYSMTTSAELTWQVWTALRLGAKGIVPFVLLPGGRHLTKEEFFAAGNSPTIDPPHRWSNVKELTFVDKAVALMLGGLEPSAQFKALGECYAKLGLVVDELAGTESTYPLAWAEAPFSVSTLAHKRTGRRYLVVVNDDMEKASTQTIHVLPCVEGVSVLTDSQKPALAHGDADKSFELTLAPGRGALVRLGTGANSHALLFDVDYVVRDSGDQRLQRSNNVVRQAGGSSTIPTHLAVENPDKPASADYALPDKLAPATLPGRLYLTVRASKPRRFTTAEGKTITTWGTMLTSIGRVRFSSDGKTYGEPVDVGRRLVVIPRGTRSVRVEFASPDIRLERISFIYSQ